MQGTTLFLPNFAVLSNMLLIIVAPVICLLHVECCCSCMAVCHCVTLSVTVLQVCAVSTTYCCFGDGPLSAVIPNIWPPIVTSQAPVLASSSASAPAPGLPSPAAESSVSALPAPGAGPAPAPSNGSLQAVNASAPIAAADTALSPGPNPAPAPPTQNSSLSPAAAGTAVPAAAPAANSSVPVQATPSGTMANQTNPAISSPPALNATLPNSTSLVPTPAPTLAATPANSSLASANSSLSAEQIAANAALGPLLSPATGQGHLPAPPPPAAPAPAPGPAPGAVPSTGEPLSQQGKSSNASASIATGAIAGIAVGAVAIIALAASLLVFLLRRRRRQSVHDRQSPKPGVLSGGEASPKESRQSFQGGSPPKVLSGTRVLSGSRNPDVEPLRGHLLESSSTALLGTGNITSYLCHLAVGVLS